MSRAKLGVVGTVLCLGVSMTLGACSKRSEVAPEPGAPADSTAPSDAVALPSPGPSAGASAPREPVCTVSSRTSWGKNANQRTGITSTTLADGRIALGVAFGDAPAMLVFTRDGKGELVRVHVDSALPLGSALGGKDGRRDLQRVTPVLGAGGKLIAYADYRDRWSSGRRRISCGQADAKAQLFEFDGAPLLDGPAAQPAASVASAAQTGVPHAGEPPAPASLAPRASASAPSPGKPRPRLRLPGQLKPLGAPPAVSAEPGSPGSPPIPSAPPPPKTEIRDCRSFVDEGGKNAWAAASELHGVEEAGGAMKWTMRLLVLGHGGEAPVAVYSVALPAQPKKLETFETTVAAERPGGGWALFARHEGGLLGWTLDARHRRQSGPRRWGGGYPSPPRLFLDGGELLAVTALKRAPNDFLPRYLRVGASGLAAAYTALALTGSERDASEPVLARSGDQRWLAYHSGKRREGLLRVVPVNEKLASVGAAFDVTPEGESAYESYLTGLDGGRLLVVYVQGGSASELVSEVLTCSVRS
ncbi:MAG: hypothetical protein OZ921_03890 [Sorangiineae bacterium]|nr:hypothetical protein [Polyangiaceae bacterium]MEB2321632.1 hypothetical protein [Sorangiineae bacterium]